ncbi:hypothetical protein LSUE1_G006975 [Lachnellula suecica]|uniref:Uncharacterized protein n=1 Tax=Lachnellula suecica TaxID=602035 RepID=A0A8T9BVV4_9HELO|nr:hypothetical protein LSUE1_G006975 [Lachnellula suecica]
MAIQQTASGIFAYVQSLVDRVVSPSTRQNIYNNTGSFAKEQPLLAVGAFSFKPLNHLCTSINWGSAPLCTSINQEPKLTIPPKSFLAIQLALSLTPLLLFASFVLGVASLSFISALLFTLFWTGVALLFLLPTLFVTVSLGLIVWIWAVATLVVVRWVYNFVPVRGAASAQLVNGKVVSVEKKEGEFPKGEVQG